MQQIQARTQVPLLEDQKISKQKEVAIKSEATETAGERDTSRSKGEVPRRRPISDGLSLLAGSCNEDFMNY